MKKNKRDFPSSRRNFDRRDSARFKAVCASCGADCEVPFNPTGSKPVYCDNCFKANKNQAGDRRPQTDQFSAQFQSLNEKLDKILKVLSAGAPEKTASKKAAPAKKTAKKSPP